MGTSTIPRGQNDSMLIRLRRDWKRIVKQIEKLEMREEIGKEGYKQESVISFQPTQYIYVSMESPELDRGSKSLKNPLPRDLNFNLLRAGQLQRRSSIVSNCFS